MRTTPASLPFLQGHKTLLQHVTFLGFAILASITLCSTAHGQTGQKGNSENRSSKEEMSNEEMSDEKKQNASSENSEPIEPKKVRIGRIEWYVDYDAALKIAQRENKPMWLHFGENPG